MFDLVPSAFKLPSSDPSSPFSEAPISISSDPLDFAEYCESPRCRPGFAGSSFLGVVMAAGKGDAGRGLWSAKAPKLALVGVVASSRCIGGGCELGAVFGRGVVGVVSSPLRPWGSGTRVVFTGRKVDDILSCMEEVEVRSGYK